VWAAVADVHAAGGTAIVATHDLHEAEQVATRVVVVDAGRVVADGSVRELTARAGLTRVAYTGSDGPVVTDVPDAGAAVAELVRAGTELRDLEVRPLSLEEAVARLRREVT
jgi:ABC-2 type transport system ATP-binding protein